MKWKYGNSWEKFPIERGHVWGNEDSRIKVLNWMKNEIPNWMRADMVYCDPPYVPLSETSSFTNYSGDGFSNEDQEELVELARNAQKRGAVVLISNHDTEITRQLYEGANIIEVNVRRSISAKTDGRKEVKEIIAIFI